MKKIPRWSQRDIFGLARMRKDPKGEYIPMTTTPVITHPDTRKLRRAELDLLIAQARIRRLEERIKELEEK